MAMTGSVIYTRLDPGEPAEVGLAAQERAIGGFLEQRSDAAPLVGRFCDAGPEIRPAIWPATGRCWTRSRR